VLRKTRALPSSGRLPASFQCGLRGLAAAAVPFFRQPDPPHFFGASKQVLFESARALSQDSCAAQLVELAELSRSFPCSLPDSWTPAQRDYRDARKSTAVLVLTSSKPLGLRSPAEVSQRSGSAVFRAAWLVGY